MSRTATASRSLRMALLADLITTVWADNRNASVADRADLVARATESSPLFRTYLLNAGVNADGFVPPANADRFDPPKKVADSAPTDGALVPADITTD